MNLYGQSPSLPEACVICGKAANLQLLTITRVFTPSWVWFLLPLGVLPAAVVGLAVQIKHTLSLRFCELCRSRRSWSTVVHWLAMLLCLILIFTAVAAGVINQSVLVFFGVMVVAVAVAIVSGRFHERVNPRYVVFTKTRVELEIPVRGRFIVFPN
jgi:hypothetical protein